MKIWWPLLLCVMPLLAGAQTENVDRPDEAGGSKGIYRTVDADGNVVFTDNPPDKKRAEEVKVGPTNNHGQSAGGAARRIPGRCAAGTAGAAGYGL